jgi:hypothetical protein
MHASRTKGLKTKLVEGIQKSASMSTDARISFIASLPYALFSVSNINVSPAINFIMSQFSDETIKQLKHIDLRKLCSPLFQLHHENEQEHLQMYAAIILQSISRIVLFSLDKSAMIPTCKDSCIHINAKDSRQSLVIDQMCVLRGVLDDPLEMLCNIQVASVIPLVTGVLDHVIDLLKLMEFKGGTLNSLAARRALFDCLTLLCIVCSEVSLNELTTVVIETTGFINNTRYTNNTAEVQIAPPGQSLNALQWLLRVPFSEEDDELRTYAAKWLGTLLPLSGFKILKSLYISDINAAKLQHSFIPIKFFNDIDNMLHEFCGMTQSELSCTMKSTLTAVTFTSIANIREIAKSCSRQISVIRFISGLCQHLKEDEQMRSTILEKGMMRLMRFWISASILSREEREDGPNFEVAQAAFGEMLRLKKHGIFSNKSIPNFDRAIVPGFISEIISRTLFAQSANTKDRSSESGHSLLCQFVQSFLVNDPSDQATSSESDRLYKVLLCFDSAIPATIAGLVLEKDYEAVCECTKFRLYLLSELKILDRKSKDDAYMEDEKVLGVNAPKRKQSFSKERQTSRLCVMSGNDLNILGPILKSLLLEQDKSHLVFFAKKVVGSNISIGQLLQKSEFTVLDELICELGECEEEPGDDDFVREVWKTFYKNRCAYQAMKRAVLFLRSAKDAKQQSSEESLSFTPDATDIRSLNSVDADQLVQEWVRKYYMRLLVNVTTKWKRGSIDTKISAMRCLRVLLRFIPITDSPQYATQVFGIVDGCMYLGANLSKRDDRLSRLQFLAVRCLSDFVRVIISHNLHIVGDNLCNIIVSLSPLFNTLNSASTEVDNVNNVTSRTLNDAIEILETLVDGKVGKKLASYFESVPFLPKDARLQNVRDTLRRHGINFDNLLLLSTQLSCSEPLPRSREVISSSSSTSAEEEKALISHRNKLHFALRKRLNSLEKLLNNENENVRRLSLIHIIDVVRGHRDLFQSVVKVEHSSLRFLTVKSDQQTISRK